MFRPTKIFIQHLSPHIHRSRTAQMCMWHVIIALLPTTLCAIAIFGFNVLAVILTSIAACVLTEWAVVKFMLGSGYKMSLTAAALTGLLLGLNLPVSIPLWTVVIGAVVAIGIGKMAFGGLGCNIFNPALVGRVFMLISFPVAMTTWTLPGYDYVAEGTTGATILTTLKEGASATTGASMLNHAPVVEVDYQYIDLLFGNIGGSMGEVTSIALIIGFIYLLVVKVISWHIPVSIVATVFVFDLCLDVPAGVDILSGGLLLGAIFMATDYVTSPMTHKGMVVYGVMIGIITVVIRRWGAYPEGMSFAILIMNGFTPLINRYMKPRRFGIRRKEALV